MKLPNYKIIIKKWLSYIKNASELSRRVDINIYQFFDNKK